MCIGEMYKYALLQSEMLPWLSGPERVHYPLLLDSISFVPWLKATRPLADTASELSRSCFPAWRLLSKAFRILQQPHMPFASCQTSREA